MPDDWQEVGDEVDRRGEVGDEERQRELRPPRYARVAKQPPTEDETVRDERGEVSEPANGPAQTAASACRSSKSSAIWTAFNAAPLRRLSQTTQSASPSPAASRRIRPTSTSSVPAASRGVGRSARRIPGAAARTSRARSGESGSSVSTQTACEWPTRTGTRAQVALSGSSGSSRIFRVSARSFDSSSDSSPSNSQSMTTFPSPGVCARSCSICGAPAPDTELYVATRTRRRPAASCRGPSAQTSWIVEQFGLATMPWFSVERSPFTSGTTSGTPSASRKAEDLSTQTAPPLTAAGTSSLLAGVPMEKKQRSRSPAPSASAVASSTTTSPAPYGSFDPAERAEANARTRSKPRSARSARVTGPTAPVAPTTPIRGCSAMRPDGLGTVELESGMEGRDRALDRFARNEAGDLDRRGGDDLGLNPERLERSEGLRRHPRVALHAGADHAHLAQILARRPRD